MRVNASLLVLQYFFLSLRPPTSSASVRLCGINITFGQSPRFNFSKVKPQVNYKLEKVKSFGKVIGGTVLQEDKIREEMAL